MCVCVQGPTHRLEITPGTGEAGRSDATILRVSDLSNNGPPTDIVVERESPMQGKLHSLRTEVDHLQTEVREKL